MKLRLLKQIYQSSGSYIDDLYTGNETFENDLILQSFNNNTNQWENVPIVEEYVDGTGDFINQQTGKTDKDEYHESIYGEYYE